MNPESFMEASQSAWALVYADTVCTWTTPYHNLPTTRVKTEGYVRNRASECIHNPTLREVRQREQDREEANKRSLAEV